MVTGLAWHQQSAKSDLSMPRYNLKVCQNFAGRPHQRSGNGYLSWKFPPRLFHMITKNHQIQHDKRRIPTAMSKWYNHKITGLDCCNGLSSFFNDSNCFVSTILLGQHCTQFYQYSMGANHKHKHEPHWIIASSASWITLDRLISSTTYLTCLGINCWFHKHLPLCI